MRRFAWLFMTIALISANGIVAHGQQPLTRKQIMESGDKNRDGKIGRIEVLERMREVFFFVDINKDGVLTIAEYQRIQGADPRQFARADRNTDGKLSMDEFLKAYGQKTQKHLFSSIYGPATACSWP